MIRLLNQNNYLILLIIIVFILGLINSLNVVYFFTPIDSEHDYLGNAFHIKTFLNQYSIHHPGSLLYYLQSLILIFFDQENFNLDFLISISRAIFFVCCFIIIYLSSLLTNNKLKYFLISSFFFVFGFPVFFYSVKLNAESFLFCISLVIIILLNKDNLNKNLKYISILFALILSIKITSIILLPIIIFALIKISENLKVFLYKFFINFTLFFIVYLIISIPVIGLLPITYAVALKRIFILLNDLNISIFTFFIIILSLSFIFFFLILKFYSKIKKISNYNFQLIYLILFSSIIFIISLKNNLRQDFLLEFILNSRHIIVLFPVIIIFFNNSFSIKIIYFLLVFLSIIFALSNYNSIYNKKNNLDNYLISNNESIIFLFPNFNYNSKILFLKWSFYIYANNKIDYNNIIIENQKINIQNINFLNLRQHFKTSLTNDIKKNIQKNNFLDNLLGLRENLKTIRDRKKYEKNFIENAIYGFTPNLNNEYDICLSQLDDNLKQAKFLISKTDLNNSEYSREQILKVFLDCGYKYEIQFLKKYQIYEINFMKN